MKGEDAARRSPGSPTGQSQELDSKQRLALVLDIQHRLEDDVAKPMPGRRNAYFARWPYVKNLVPHAPVYNFADAGGVARPVGRLYVCVSNVPGRWPSRR